MGETQQSRGKKSLTDTALLTGYVNGVIDGLERAIRRLEELEQSSGLVLADLKRWLSQEKARRDSLQNVSTEQRTNS